MSSHPQRERNLASHPKTHSNFFLHTARMWMRLENYNRKNLHMQTRRLERSSDVVLGVDGAEERRAGGREKQLELCTVLCRVISRTEPKIFLLLRAREKKKDLFCLAHFLFFSVVCCHRRRRRRFFIPFCWKVEKKSSTIIAWHSVFHHSFAFSLFPPSYHHIVVTQHIYKKPRNGEIFHFHPLSFFFSLASNVSQSCLLFFLKKIVKLFAAFSLVFVRESITFVCNIFNFVTLLHTKVEVTAAAECGKLKFFCVSFYS